MAQRNVFQLLMATCVFQGAPLAAEPISFVDHEGRHVELDAPAERIAAIPIPMASTVIAIDGGTEKLVGMNPTAKSAILEGILGQIFPEARDIASDITAPDFIPDVEELAARRPDLVIQWAGRGADFADPITNAGMTAMLIEYGTEGVTRDYMTTAAAMGLPERVAALNDWREEVEAHIAALSAAIPEDERPKVLYLLRAIEGLRASGTEGNYNAWYIDLTGGRPKTSSAAGPTSTSSRSRPGTPTSSCSTRSRRRSTSAASTATRSCRRPRRRARTASTSCRSAATAGTRRATRAR